MNSILRRRQHVSLGSPADVIATLFSMDRKLAIPVLAGLAIFAAGAIVRTWGVDSGSSVLIGLYVVGFGTLLYLIAFIVNDRRLKKVLSWFITLFLMVVFIVFFISAVVPGQTMIAPTYCLARFWEACLPLAQQVTNRLPGVQNPDAPSARESTRVTSFTVQTADVQLEGGIRYWSLKGDHWEERYPSGKMDRFINPVRMSLDGCAGTGVVRATEVNFLAFIPDKGCSAMAVRWQRNGGWNFLGLMTDVI